MDLDDQDVESNGDLYRSRSSRNVGKRPVRDKCYIDSERLESIERRAGESSPSRLPLQHCRMSETLTTSYSTIVILNHILNGAILRAVEALNTHFPGVLSSDGSQSNGNSSQTNGVFHPIPSYTNGNGHGVSLSSSSSSSSNDYSLPVFHTSLEPRHVKLNLEIQQFIENFRQLSPSSPSSPSSSMSSILSQPTNGLGNSRTLAHTLAEAQGLHVEAKRLLPEERAVYLEEIKDAGALFAYTNPETSILKGFLEQGRRIALAQQVNGAILSESLWHAQRMLIPLIIHVFRIRKSTRSKSAGIIVTQSYSSVLDTSGEQNRHQTAMDRR